MPVDVSCAHAHSFDEEAQIDERVMTNWSNRVSCAKPLGEPRAPTILAEAGNSTEPASCGRGPRVAWMSWRSRGERAQLRPDDQEEPNLKSPNASVLLQLLGSAAN